jgi:hypothetical protein
MQDESHVTIVSRSYYLLSRLIFIAVSILFILISLLLIIIAFVRLWDTVTGLPSIRLDALFEAIGYTTISSAVFELGRTMYEEEAGGGPSMNTTRKIRNFMSRFLTVIIISLGIEFLTMVFRYSHKADEFGFLYNAAAVGIAAAALLVAWAYFNRMSARLEVAERFTNKGDEKGDDMQA